MRNQIRRNVRSFLVFAVLSAGISFSFAGCSSPKPAAQPAASGPRRYALQGRVVSLDKDKQQVIVDHGEIPGFMMPMTMPYSVKDSHQLDSVSPEDQITADVVVNGDEIWLERIVVTKKAAQTMPPSK